MVTAFMFLALTCAVACVFCIIACSTSPYGNPKDVFGGMAVVAGLICVGMFITSYSVYIKHWNETCHSMGGQLNGTQACVKGPIKKIDVP